MALWRVDIDDKPRLAVGDPDQGPQDLLAPVWTLARLLEPGKPSLPGVADLKHHGPVPEGVRPLVPIDVQPVWAAGVTFERSLEARNEEAVSGRYYDLVYDAERPELFPKALPGHARGPNTFIGIRTDSTWDVPEPELGLVIDHAGLIVGYVLGNDVSSRSIEGENPLYLPQAKVYEGSCAIGPCLVPVDEAPEFSSIEMTLTVNRGGTVLYKNSVSLSQMRRRPEELVDWLFRAQRFPAGVVLLTGTSIVPGREVTLQPGDEVTVAASALGALRNTVELVGLG